MPILQVGVSHRRAPLDLLERLAFAEGDLPKAYRRLADDPDVREAVLLSTCNRVEIYGDVVSYHAGSMALRRLLSAASEVSPGELAGENGVLQASQAHHARLSSVRSFTTAWAHPITSTPPLSPPPRLFMRRAPSRRSASVLVVPFRISQLSYPVTVARLSRTQSERKQIAIPRPDRSDATEAA